ncbi:MAG: Hsp20/alpha crystallin family protein [Thermoplasmata archaeon]|nr:Hsp20/alpha crystallin family protein [Thermoplasmata archaeon]
MAEDDPRNRDDWPNRWPVRRRRDTSWPFDDMFPDLFDIEEEFQRMQRYMDAVFRNMLNDVPAEGGPFVYGFSITTGPDGKPHIQQFGNTLPRRGGVEQGAACIREPIVDVDETPEAFSVTAELPGVEKEDVDLILENDTLVIRAKARQCEYYKEIPLPPGLDENKIKATCKNGILDVTLPKKVKDKPKGRRIKIE